MKAHTLALLAISITIICIIGTYPVSALEQNDISLSPIWSTPLYFQGDVVTIKIVLTNNSSDLLTVYTVGIHLDWMGQDEFAGRNLSNDPVVVASHETYVFDPVAINIPSDVSVGDHEYTLGVEVSEGSSSTIVSWDSQARGMQILAAGAKPFRELSINVSTKINKAINATYQSPEAISLLEQANNEYGQAFMASFNEEWDEALAHLNTAYDYAEQAAEAEQQYLEQAANLQQLILIIAPIIALIIVAIVVILMWRRRKPKTEEYDSTDQTYDEQPETQDYTPEE